MDATFSDSLTVATMSYTAQPSVTVMDGSLTLSPVPVSESELSGQSFDLHGNAFLHSPPQATAWPATPPGACEEFENYSYSHNSPPYSVQPTPISMGDSPRTWSTGESYHPPSAWTSPEQMPSRGDSPSTPDDAVKREMPLSLQTNMMATLFPERLTKLSARSPGTRHPSSFPQTPCSSPPASVLIKTENGGSSSASGDYGVDTARNPVAVVPRAVHELGGSQPRAMSPQSLYGEDTARAIDLPYAQLIYQCFMELEDPRQGLTLQAIYDYFRTHTDKCNNGGKGWQNSIRHNLSMNEGFVKGDKLPDRCSGDSSKRASEWMLTDEAIRNGIESTTRYRKGKPTKMKRCASLSHGIHVSNGRISSKIHSGRRGGYCASRTRRAERDKQELQQCLQAQNFQAPGQHNYHHHNLQHFIEHPPQPIALAGGCMTGSFSVTPSLYRSQLAVSPQAVLGSSTPINNGDGAVAGHGIDQGPGPQVLAHPGSMLARQASMGQAVYFTASIGQARAAYGQEAMGASVGSASAFTMADVIVGHRSSPPFDTSVSPAGGEPTSTLTGPGSSSVFDANNTNGGSFGAGHWHGKQGLY